MVEKAGSTELFLYADDLNIYNEIESAEDDQLFKNAKVCARESECQRKFMPLRKLAIISFTSAKHEILSKISTHRL